MVGSAVSRALRAFSEVVRVIPAGQSMVEKVYKANLESVKVKPQFINGKWVWPGDENEEEDAASKPPPMMMKTETNPTPSKSSGGGLDALMAPPSASFGSKNKKKSGGLSSLMAPPSASFLHRSRAAKSTSKSTSSKKSRPKMFTPTMFVPTTGDTEKDVLLESGSGLVKKEEMKNEEETKPGTGFNQWVPETTERRMRSRRDRQNSFQSVGFGDNGGGRDEGWTTTDWI